MSVAEQMSNMYMYVCMYVPCDAWDNILPVPTAVTRGTGTDTSGFCTQPLKIRSIWCCITGLNMQNLVDVLQISHNQL
jgi:hypothetical protein